MPQRLSRRIGDSHGDTTNPPQILKKSDPHHQINPFPSQIQHKPTFLPDSPASSELFWVSSKRARPPLKGGHGCDEDSSPDFSRRRMAAEDVHTKGTFSSVWAKAEAAAEVPAPPPGIRGTRARLAAPAGSRSPFSRVPMMEVAGSLQQSASDVRYSTERRSFLGVGELVSSDPSAGGGQPGRTFADIVKQIKPSSAAARIPSPGVVPRRSKGPSESSIMSDPSRRTKQASFMIQPTDPEGGLQRRGNRCRSKVEVASSICAGEELQEPADSLLSFKGSSLRRSSAQVVQQSSVPFSVPLPPPVISATPSAAPRRPLVRFSPRPYVAVFQKALPPSSVGLLGRAIQPISPNANFRPKPILKVRPPFSAHPGVAPQPKSSSQKPDRSYPSQLLKGDQRHTAQGETSQQQWQPVRKKHWWRRKRRDRRAACPHSRTGRPTGNPVPCQRTLNRCFNCLASDHRVAQCRNPTRCWKCFRFGHVSFRCRYSYPVTSTLFSKKSLATCLNRARPKTQRIEWEPELHLAASPLSLFYPREELIADGKVLWRDLSWQYGRPDGDVTDEDEFIPFTRRCGPDSEPRKQPRDDDDRDRDHKRMKPRSFMGKVSSWIGGRSQSKSRPPEGGRGRSWYYGEPSHGRELMQQKMSALSEQEASPFCWCPAESMRDAQALITSLTPHPDYGDSAYKLPLNYNQGQDRMSISDAIVIHPDKSFDEKLETIDMSACVVSRDSEAIVITPQPIPLVNLLQQNPVTNTDGKTSVEKAPLHLQKLACHNMMPSASVIHLDAAATTESDVPVSANPTLSLASSPLHSVAETETVPLAPGDKEVETAPLHLQQADCNVLRPSASIAPLDTIAHVKSDVSMHAILTLTEVAEEKKKKNNKDKKNKKKIRPSAALAPPDTIAPVKSDVPMQANLTLTEVAEEKKKKKNKDKKNKKKIRPSASIAPLDTVAPVKSDISMQAILTLKEVAEEKKKKKNKDKKNKKKISPSASIAPLDTIAHVKSDVSIQAVLTLTEVAEVKKKKKNKDKKNKKKIRAAEAKEEYKKGKKVKKA